MLGQLGFRLEPADGFADQRRDGFDELDQGRRELAGPAIRQVDGAEDSLAARDGNDGDRGEAELNAGATIPRLLLRRELLGEVTGVVAAIRAAGRQEGAVRALGRLRDGANATAIIALERKPVLQLDELPARSPPRLRRVSPAVHSPAGCPMPGSRSTAG